MEETAVREWGDSIFVGLPRGGDVHNGRQRRNRNPISCMRIYASAWHHFSLRALVEYVPNATDVHDADLGRYVAWLWHGRL